MRRVLARARGPHPCRRRHPRPRRTGTGATCPQNSGSACAERSIRSGNGSSRPRCHPATDQNGTRGPGGMAHAAGRRLMTMNSRHRERSPVQKSVFAAAPALPEAHWRQAGRAARRTQVDELDVSPVAKTSTGMTALSSPCQKSPRRRRRAASALPDTARPGRRLAPAARRNCNGSGAAPPFRRMRHGTSATPAFPPATPRRLRPHRPRAGAPSWPSPWISTASNSRT